MQIFFWKQLPRYQRSQQNWLKYNKEKIGIIRNKCKTLKIQILISLLYYIPFNYEKEIKVWMAFDIAKQITWWSMLQSRNWRIGKEIQRVVLVIPVIPIFILKTDQPATPEVKLSEALEQAHIQQFKAGTFKQIKGKVFSFLVEALALWDHTQSQRTLTPTFRLGNASWAYFPDTFVPFSSLFGF